MRLGFYGLCVRLDESEASDVCELCLPLQMLHAATPFANSHHAVGVGALFKTGWILTCVSTYSGSRKGHLKIDCRVNATIEQSFDLSESNEAEGES